MNKIGGGGGKGKKKKQGIFLFKPGRSGVEWEGTYIDKITSRKDPGVDNFWGLEEAKGRA